MSAAFYTVRELWDEVARLVDDSGVGDQNTGLAKGYEVTWPTIKFADTIIVGTETYGIFPYLEGGEVSLIPLKVNDVLQEIATTVLDANNSALGDLDTPIPKGVDMSLGDLNITGLPAMKLRGDQNQDIQATATLKGEDANPIGAKLSGGTTPIGAALSGGVGAALSGSVGAAVSGSLTATVEGGGSPIAATIAGGATPIAATISTPSGEAVAATVNVATPVAINASVGGPSGSPINAVVNLGAFNIRPDLEVKFSLLGVTICSVKMVGRADVGS